MDIARFQEISAVLLRKHYGLGLNDTLLWDRVIVASYLQEGTRPFEAVAEHASETDLDRVDVFQLFDLPSQAPITEADEEAAIAALSL